MFDAFIKSILDDTPPPIDIYKSLDYTLPGLCAHMSAEKGGSLLRYLILDIGKSAE